MILRKDEKMSNEAQKNDRQNILKLGILGIKNYHPLLDKNTQKAIEYIPCQMKTICLVKSSPPSAMP